MSVFLFTDEEESVRQKWPVQPIHDSWRAFYSYVVLQPVLDAKGSDSSCSKDTYRIFRRAHQLERSVEWKLRSEPAL
jgi:hypothetical protein